jgi:hypothetical protein
VTDLTSHAGTVEPDAAFVRVQQKLTAAWRADLPGSVTPHLIVALPSVSLDAVLLSHYAPRIPALEQRYLISILLLRNPTCRVAYVSCSDVPDYLVRYYASLVPGLELDDVRRRLTLVSLDDRSPRPLTEKLLERPETLAQLRRLGEGLVTMIEPWNVTAAERELAIELEMPLYGAHPRLWRLGTKSAARRLFIEEGVPCPAGVEGVSTPAEVVEAVTHLRKLDPELRAVVIKLDNSAAGDGNAVIDLAGVPAPGSARERAALMRRLYALPGWYVQSLAAASGIVETWIEAEDFRSPSAQLTITPTGEVVVLSTHDQILGGHSGQVYEGCRFPADPSYAVQIGEYGAAVGRRLARKGVIGRFSVDFATVRDASGSWRSYALEINLRKGGTTHPFATVRALAQGRYDAAEASFTGADGRLRYYVATDNLLNDGWRTLDPREVVSRVADAGLAYDVRQRTGVVLHMLECLPVDGRFGLTAIGTTRDEAEALYVAVPHALD